MMRLLPILLILSLTVNAQQKAPGLPAVENLQDFYRTGVGVRAGWPVAALTIKHFIQKQIALEFITAPQFGGVSISILTEMHRPTKRPGMYWYYGAGIDGGLYSGERFKNYNGETISENDVFSFGLAAILGVEMNIHETPFSVGFDLKPHIGIYNSGGSIMEGAVTFKYIWGW